MSPKLLKSFLLFLLSISIPFSSEMVVEPLRDGKIADKSIFKIGGTQMNGRKLMTLDVQDYDETKANNRHKIGGTQMNGRKLMTLDVQDYDETKANNRHDPKKPGNGKP